MNENATSLLQRVGGYYQDKGISPSAFNDFACEFKDKCVGCAKSPSKFAPGKEALVTTGYERRALPRLLFLSAEPGVAGKIPSERKALASREWEENEYNPEEGRRLQHWTEVHHFALYILQCFRPQLTLKETSHFIAHTNSAKCCVNNRDSQQARSELFDNCRGFIGSELKLLAPDILVTQGEPC